jgi:hypothetical protein
VIFFYFALERTSETVKLVYLQNNRDWKNKIEKSRENFIEKGAERNTLSRNVKNYFERSRNMGNYMHKE